MANYIDLLITSNDLSLDQGNIPLLVTDRASIAQDIKHMIRESGLLVELIGERDAGTRAVNRKRIEILVDEDRRIRPGTASIIEVDASNYFVTAKTMDYGEIEFYL